jgi:hypothetical protein
VVKRLEALTTRKYTTKDGEVKTSWTKIGVAFQHNSGDGYNVALDAMPAPTIKDGQAVYEIVLRPPMEKDQQRGNGGPSRAAAPELDDSIPFIRGDLLP